MEVDWPDPSLPMCSLVNLTFTTPWYVITFRMWVHPESDHVLGVVKVEEFTLETPPSHEEKGLMTIEQFLGCAIKVSSLDFE